MVERIKEKLDNCIKVVREVYEDMNEIVVKFSTLGEENNANYQKTLDIYNKQAHIYLRTAQKIYRFLQLLCEGHNRKMQNYFREQFSKEHPLYSRNINFV